MKREQTALPTKEIKMKNNNLNDLIAVTPSMERFTIQANALSTACDKFSFENVTYMRAQVIVFINNFMDNNEHDELGNWADIEEMVKMELRN